MDFSTTVTGMAGKDFYLYLTSENPDWTLDGDGVGLCIHHSGKRVVLPMSDPTEVSYLVSSMHHFVADEAVVLSWRAKDVFSFLKGRTGIPLELPGRLYDLHVVCSYFGYGLERPESFKDALSVLRRALSEPTWPRFKEFYDSVHLPLMSRVLPDIETSCLVNLASRSCVYPSYVLEGQVNGRLKTCINGPNSYNPHSLGPKEKARLRPPGYDAGFVCFDFRNMEVNVLRWLSGDDRLGEIIDSGLDPYREIWRIIAREEPTDAKRELCKNTFLPVVFGQGVASLAKRLKISEKVAGFVIDRLVKAFPVAFEWVDSQSVGGDGFATDAFGRRRHLARGEEYKVRNFCVQSPASMVCLKKLVDLHECLPDSAGVCFHVHDGYCVVCDRSDFETVAGIGTSCLESEDEMFPGLALKTSCNAGPNLNNLEPVEGRVST